MSSDDSDTDRGDAEASQSGADGDGPQPRDPETGQFLPKGEREAAETDDGAATPEPDDDVAADPDRSDTGRESDPADSGSRRSEPARGTAPPLRITRVPVQGGAPRDRAAVGSSEPLLPPSLHLVPMQVQCTGEPVRVEPSTGRLVGLDGSRRRAGPSERVRPIRRETR